MNRFKQMRLPVFFEESSYTDSDHVTITFGDAAEDRWTLGLCLLRENMISVLELEDEQQSYRLRLKVGPGLKAGDRAVATASKRQIEITLGQTELEAWLHFFLRMVRDGVAEVDHLDLETRPPEGQPRPTDLTLRVLRVPEPMSPDELRRQLGM